MTDLIDAQDQQDDLDPEAELMTLLGQEVRVYIAEQIQGLHERLDQQAEILDAIKRLETVLSSPRVIVQDSSGKPVGVRILSGTAA